jgi:hypothetical protein
MERFVEFPEDRRGLLPVVGFHVCGITTAKFRE